MRPGTYPPPPNLTLAQPADELEELSTGAELDELSTDEELDELISTTELDELTTDEELSITDELDVLTTSELTDELAASEVLDELDEFESAPPPPHPCNASTSMTAKGTFDLFTFILRRFETRGLQATIPVTISLMAGILNK